MEAFPRTFPSFRDKWFGLRGRSFLWGSDSLVFVHWGFLGTFGGIVGPGGNPFGVILRMNVGHIKTATAAASSGPPALTICSEPFGPPETLKKRTATVET